MGYPREMPDSDHIRCVSVVWRNRLLLWTALIEGDVGGVIPWWEMVLLELEFVNTVVWIENDGQAGMG